MKKLSKWTRLPQIPELNKPPVSATFIILLSIIVFFYYILFENTKSPLWITILFMYQFTLYYSPRMIIAKDLFFRNFIEFKGKIIEVSNEKMYSPALTSIKIKTSVPIQQSLDQIFLILTPCDLNTTIFSRLKHSSTSLVTIFPLDQFLQQEMIFRSFQQSAFIFDLGIILTDQLDRDIIFFFYHLEYFNQQGKKQTLKYKRIEQVKHHIHFKDRSHIVKLIFYKAEFTFICDKTQFMRLRELLYSSNISFL